MFNIISDLHIEMYYPTDYRMYDNYDYCMGNTDKLPLEIKNMIRTSVYEYINQMLYNTDIFTNTLIIAGDISNDNSYSKEFLIQASKIWKNVWFVDGNHDYYFQNKESKDNRLNKLIYDLKDYSNIKYVANTVQKINYNDKVAKIGFLPLMYNINNPDVYDMFTREMNDRNFIDKDYIYNSYKSGLDFYNNKIYGKCDICVSHVPVMVLDGTDGKETTYFTKLKLDHNITYIFGHTHKVGRVTNYIETDYNSENIVNGYSIGVGYPDVYERGVGIPHTKTFVCLDE